MSVDPRHPRFPDVASYIREHNPDESVYCFRPSVLEAKTREFIDAFPGIVLYAIKCNPHPWVIDALLAAGIRDFEAASLSEIEQIARLPEATRTFFMHPAKSRRALRAAHAKQGVRYFAVDHVTELNKLREEIDAGPAAVLVRLAAVDTGSALYTLSSKFGAGPDECVELLRQAAAAGFDTGLTFHVGSQCLDPMTYTATLELVGDVLARAGVAISCLDIGGGFPVAYPGVPIPPVGAFMSAISEAVDRLQLPPGVTLCAEPGRALVADSCSLLTRVMLRKPDRLYLNDGVHGGLSELLDSRYQLATRVYRNGDCLEGLTTSFELFGPTCDSVDRIPVRFDLPAGIQEGDWIEFDQVGAYSNALATTFNGFSSDRFIQVDGAFSPNT